MRSGFDGRRFVGPVRLAGAILVAACALSVSVCAQNSSPSKSQDSGSANSKTQPQKPNLEAPRSDRVNINELPDTEGESSSKDTQIDLTPPPDDDKAHPKSSEILMDESPAGGDVHPWDPHRAAKDVEVGDFYFKRKNYRAAEDRYREALYYKDNDALATYHLAICLEKLDRPDEARAQYESYLKILPNGPQAADAKKAIERLSKPESTAKAKQ